jgi:cellulose synthase/poly-beta-1,6-N-acetylglucosamine synthase-like glycosyltransferase
MQATADVLVFVDADVIVHADALALLRTAFGADPNLTAVFGSYDDNPASQDLVSQFRNLLHHHLHQRHPGVAATFWSGLGAVRRAEFLELGGFDTTRYAVPAVEDIDLGMRLQAMGGRIELHPEVLGTHLKCWTLASMIHTDFHRRGVPWALMCLERRSVPPTLNLSWRERASSVAMLLAVGGLLSKRRRMAGASLVALGSLDASFYWLLYRRIGIGRAMLSVGLHALHRVVGVAALPGGVVEYVRRRQR